MFNIGILFLCLSAWLVRTDGCFHEIFDDGDLIEFFNSCDFIPTSVSWIFEIFGGTSRKPTPFIISDGFITTNGTGLYCLTNKKPLTVIPKSELVITYYATKSSILIMVIADAGNSRMIEIITPEIIYDARTTERFSLSYNHDIFLHFIGSTPTGNLVIESVTYVSQPGESKLCIYANNSNDNALRDLGGTEDINRDNNTDGNSGRTYRSVDIRDWDVIIGNRKEEERGEHKAEDSGYGGVGDYGNRRNDDGGSRNHDYKDIQYDEDGNSVNDDSGFKNNSDRNSGDNDNSDKINDRVSGIADGGAAESVNGDSGLGEEYSYGGDGKSRDDGGEEDDENEYIFYNRDDRNGLAEGSGENGHGDNEDVNSGDGEGGDGNENGPNFTPSPSIESVDGTNWLTIVIVLSIVAGLFFLIVLGGGCYLLGRRLNKNLTNYPYYLDGQHYMGPSLPRAQSHALR